MNWLLIAALGSLSISAAAQVRISEFMASNTLASPDIVDFEDYPDWIELENSSTNTVSLKGWYLSDDPSKPLRWAFPSTASIPAHGYMVVWADGRDAIPGESHPRGYWPWRDFITEGYHANFSLSAGGETLVLTRSTGAVTTHLITAGTSGSAVASTWRFTDESLNLGSLWREPDFDDSKWASGPAQLGFGDGDESTIISAGTSPAKRPITTYFRHQFAVVDSANIIGLELRLLADDGAVVYLNGSEVVRQNMPAGLIQLATLAVSGIVGADEDAFTLYRLPSTHLFTGTNTLAVEVHQSTPGSSDLSFDLSLSGLAVDGVAVEETQTYGLQLPDVSRGRNRTGQWVQFATPTPGGPNGGGEIPDLRLSAESVTTTPEGGLYSEPVLVTLTTRSGAIHYTLNGASPGPESPLYEQPFLVKTNTVVRARVIELGKPQGPVNTQTYLMGEARRTLPTLSAVADPELLFGDRLGIYYNKHELPASGSGAGGLRDVYKGKNAPGSLEYFPADGGVGFRVNGAYRMGGENNWVHAQRAMNFMLKGSYGNDSVAYDLFPGTHIPNHASFTLREGGDAWDREMLRDGLWSFIQRGQMKVGVSDYRPSVLFINGRYWGIHNLRSRWDDTWFFEHHRLNLGEVDHLLYGHLTSSSITLGADKGDTAQWLELLVFLQSHNLNDPTHFAYVESRIDLDSFIDFIAAESWGINTSWPHNREFWRPRTPGGRWQWFLPDMDQTFRASSLGVSVLSDMLSQDALLSRMKTSDAFRQRLAQRLAAHTRSTFKPERVQRLLDSMASEVESEVPRHVARWASSGGMTLKSRAAALADMSQFINARALSFLNDVQVHLNLPKPAIELTISSDPPRSGHLVLQGVPIDPGVHLLFPHLPATLRAEAAPGFKFAGWLGADGGTEILLTLTDSSKVTARFVPSDESILVRSLTADTTVKLGSILTLESDLIVPKGITLTLSAGVTLQMPMGCHLRIFGALNIEGTAEAPVRIEGRNGARWGGISFETPSAPSLLRYCRIRHATRGIDPIKFPSAISGLDAILRIEHLDIEQSEGPIFCRGGSIHLSQSHLHTPYSGDCINVKQGQAFIEDCDFIGNMAPDTDAIDYDGVIGGVVRRCRIYRFQGPNSDGIDIGEACRDILLENNCIYFNSDKGISVGQGSSVRLRHNLVVGCALGVGVKDAGSQVFIDQNTFVQCPLGISVYEKNFGVGGGLALITNTLFSMCKVAPVRADSFSQVETGYSLSDTVAIVGGGVGNLLANPRFINPSGLDFGLQVNSPALNHGDPNHAVDGDGSRSDIGAGYQYRKDDYPYSLQPTVVIDELLANSEGSNDWIELFNRSAQAVDISGWFLSNSAVDLRKYRIPMGTVLPPEGRAVFSEDQHFGASSLDLGRVTAFALSEVGETVYLSSAERDELTGYRTQEDFGPTLPSETLGNYFKSSTGTWNFVPLQTPTPGQPNSLPRRGPVVISEIHYAPFGDPESEFLELMNITTAPVSLYDSLRSSSWRLTDGVNFEFPSNPALVLAPNERIILAGSLSHFNAAFRVPPGTLVLQWTSGRLANEGESLQISQPAGLDDAGIRQFARVDRVSFDRVPPWPVEANGTGYSLQKQALNDYGNDPSPWIAALPTPGAAFQGWLFKDWIRTFNLTPEAQGPGADPDHDGIPNLLEFVLGRDPKTAETQSPLSLVTTNPPSIRFRVQLDRSGVRVQLETASALNAAVWAQVESQITATDATHQTRSALLPNDTAVRFFRLSAQ